MTTVLGRRADDVVGYTWAVDLWHPACLVAALVAGRVLSPAAHDMPAERALDQHAAANAIDRTDEQTFDSSDFPKVLFRDQVDSDDRCWRCGDSLDG